MQRRAASRSKISIAWRRVAGAHGDDAKVVAAAQQSGADALLLTDHDTLAARRDG